MFLIVIKGANTCSIFPLNKTGAIIIGRGKECDVRILDLMVSRKHCQVESRKNSFYLKDLESTNKTTVNRKVIDQETKLELGDIIELGDSALLFTDQRSVSVKSVEDYNLIRKSKTRFLDADEEITKW